MRLARAVVVNRARDDLFPGPGVARNQNCAVRCRDGFEQLEEPFHGRTLSDESFEAMPLIELRSEVRVLRLQPALFERRVERVQQFIDLERLADKIPRATFDRFDGVFHSSVTGDDNGDDVG